MFPFSLDTVWTATLLVGLFELYHVLYEWLYVKLVKVFITHHKRYIAAFTVASYGQHE